jgi:lipopolysaccharide transport system permease protein
MVAAPAPAHELQDPEATPPPRHARRRVVVQPTTGWRGIDLGELWSYRDLLYIFAWRDLKVRYRQTLLGVVWVVGQPLVTMIIFTVLFHRVARFEAGGNVPYSLFVLSGVLIWNFITGVILRAGNSLIGAAHLISKVYFPRLLVPLSNVAADAADLGFGAVLLMALMARYRFFPGPEILLAPLVVLLAVIFALGAGLWIAALNVEYRDVRVVIPWVLQVAMYVTPVVYPLSALPPRYRALAGLNPATGVVEAFRATLLGTPVNGVALAWSLTFSAVAFVGGAFYFRRVERRFADVL